MENTSDESKGERNFTVTVTYGPDSYRCCACFDNIAGGIYSCESNHSICRQCSDKISNVIVKCPLCGSTERGRNFLLERALAVHVKTCPNDRCTYANCFETLDEHKTECRYATIKCHWCQGNTTSFDFHIHAEFECPRAFTQMSCSNDISFICSPDITAIYIVSGAVESRELYISKDNGICSLMIAQEGNIADGATSVVLKYDTEGAGSVVTEISINTPSNFISGNVHTHIISAEALATMRNITVTGFIEKYYKGSRWMIHNGDDWVRGTVVVRTYNPDAIIVEYDEATYSELFPIATNMPLFRDIDERGGRNGAEELNHVEHMTEEQRVAYVLELSMDDH